ncbi:MAG: tetratricopeptide repeat protein [Elainellaceae cyanobacterium]
MVSQVKSPKISIKLLSERRFLGLRSTLSWGAVVAIALASLVGAPSISLAQEDTFPPSPLEIDETDPLLPTLVVDRPLSPQERRVLAAAINELSLQGQDEFDQGNVLEAYDIWFRELRLRRVLGIQQEVPALGRVGAIAWNESQTTELRLTTERLTEIEQEVLSRQPVNYDLLLQIAESYQQMRARTQAVRLYEIILVQARAENNLATEEQALRALGELHLAWFDYPQSAAAYRELLAFVRSQRNKVAEIDVLQQLAYIYDQGQEPAEAIAVRRELVNLFEGRQEITELPALKLAIANSFLELDRPDQAAPAFQEAFAIARSVQYYGYASEALQQLADLYEALDRPQDALVVYRLLLDVGQQSYDYYIMIDAYDQIARIHRSRGANDQALAAYQRALALAQQLSFRVDYFASQIQSLTP